MRGSAAKGRPSRPLERGRRQRRCGCRALRVAFQATAAGLTWSVCALRRPLSRGRLEFAGRNARIVPQRTREGRDSRDYRATQARISRCRAA